MKQGPVARGCAEKIVADHRNRSVCITPRSLFSPVSELLATRVLIRCEQTHKHILSNNINPARGSSSCITMIDSVSEDRHRPTTGISINHLPIQKGKQILICSNRRWGGRDTDCRFCISHLTIDQAFLSRRKTVPTPNRDTSNIWALHVFTHCIVFFCLSYPLPVSTSVATIYLLG